MSFQLEIDRAIREKRLYFVGDVLPPDWYAAFKTWYQLADAGDEKAEYNIGRAYYLGLGTDQNLVEAEKWFLKAAGKKEPRSHYLLSRLYRESGDAVQADAFFQQALILNESRAIKEVADAEEVERKRIETAIEDKKLRDEERERSDRRKEIETFTQSVQKELDDGELDAVRKLIDKQNLVDKELLLGAMSIGIALKKTESERDDEVTSAGMWKGTSQYSVKKFVKHRGLIKVTNPSQVDFEISLKPSRHVVKVKAASTEEFWTGWEGFSVDSFNVHGTAIKFPIDRIDIKSRHAVQGCFVVTACFGDEDHPVVLAFRSYRDEKLLKSSVGTRVVDFYYNVGPRMAQFIEPHYRVKKVLRYFFTVIAKLIK